MKELLKKVLCSEYYYIVKFTMSYQVQRLPYHKTRTVWLPFKIVWGKLSAMQVSFCMADLSPGWFCKAQIRRLTRVQLALTKGKCLQKSGVKPKFGCSTPLFSVSTELFIADLIPCARRILSRKEFGNVRAWNHLEES